MRSVNKQSKKIIHESSSRSFRIHEKSVSSLHKEFTKTRDITHPTLIVQPAGNKRQRRTSSVQQREVEGQGQVSRTIDNKQQASTQNNFFNDLYARVKQRNQQEKVLRRKQYQTLEQQRARSQQTGDLNINKVCNLADR